MLNQVSKKIFLSCFPLRSSVLNRNKTYLTKSIRFYFFNAGKYDINKDYYAILGLSRQTNQN